MKFDDNFKLIICIESKENNIDLNPQQERLNQDFQLARADDLIKGLDIYRESLTE